jgi:hypothetical protein
MNAFLNFWKMSSNCPGVTARESTSSAIQLELRQRRLVRRSGLGLRRRRHGRRHAPVTGRFRVAESAKWNSSLDPKLPDGSPDWLPDNCRSLDRGASGRGM